VAEYVMLGQIGSLMVPTVGAEVWYLSANTYGMQLNTSYAKAPLAGLGNDCPMTVETQDYAPVGAIGKMLLRRVYGGLAVQFGGCTVQITPITDLNTSQATTAFPFVAPQASGRILREMVVAIAVPCTYLRLRIVVTQRSGKVDLFNPKVAFKPLEVAATTVAGETS